MYPRLRAFGCSIICLLAAVVGLAYCGPAVPLDSDRSCHDSTIAPVDPEHCLIGKITRGGGVAGVNEWLEVYADGTLRSSTESSHGIVHTHKVPVNRVQALWDNLASLQWKTLVGGSYGRPMPDAFGYTIHGGGKQVSISGDSGGPTVVDQVRAEFTSLWEEANDMLITWSRTVSCLSDRQSLDIYANGVAYLYTGANVDSSPVSQMTVPPAKVKSIRDALESPEWSQFREAYREPSLEIPMYSLAGGHRRVSVFGASAGPPLLNNLLEEMESIWDAAAEDVGGTRSCVAEVTRTGGEEGGRRSLQLLADGTVNVREGDGGSMRVVRTLEVAAAEIDALRDVFVSGEWQGLHHAYIDGRDSFGQGEAGSDGPVNNIVSAGFKRVEMYEDATGPPVIDEVLSRLDRLWTAVLPAPTPGVTASPDQRPGRTRLIAVLERTYGESAPAGRRTLNVYEDGTVEFKGMIRVKVPKEQVQHIAWTLASEQWQRLAGSYGSARIGIYKYTIVGVGRRVSFYEGAETPAIIDDLFGWLWDLWSIAEHGAARGSNVLEEGPLDAHQQATDGSFYEVGNGRRVAQVFTPAQTGDVTSVRVWLAKEEHPTASPSSWIPPGLGDIEVELAHIEHSGQPAGVATWTMLPAAPVPGVSTGGSALIGYFSSPYKVVGGRRYAIILSTNGCCYRWYKDAAAYPGGAVYSSTAEIGGPWTAEAGVTQFEVHITPRPYP